MPRILRITALSLCLAAPAFSPTLAQDAPADPHAAMHAGGAMTHDEMTMPGLRGLDASPEESAELQAMFMAFPEIYREVELIDGGIRTRTWSDDPILAATLVSHISGMTTRVEEGRDPQVFIQSPTLDILFARRDTITTEITPIDGGLEVTQTSTDPEVVAALQTHAGEVSDMAARGMMAVHEMMAARMAGHN